MTTFTFDGISSTTVPEIEVVRVRRPLTGGRRDAFVEVPGRAGFWLFEEEPGARTITLEMQLLATSFEDRRSAVIALADLLDRRGLVRLIVDDEPDRFHLVKLSNAPDPEEWLNYTGTFPIELIAEPYSQALTISTSTLSPATDAPANLVIPDTVDAIPVVEITANGGTVIGFELTVDGTTLVDTDTIAAGTTKTYNSIAYVANDGANADTELDGTFNPSTLAMEGISGDFPILAPGTNVVVFDKTAGTATSATVEFSWRRRSR